MSYWLKDVKIENNVVTFIFENMETAKIVEVDAKRFLFELFDLFKTLKPIRGRILIFILKLFFYGYLSTVTIRIAIAKILRKKDKLRKKEEMKLKQKLSLFNSALMNPTLSPYIDRMVEKERTN